MVSERSAGRQDPKVKTQYDAWARVYDLFWTRYMNQTLPVLQQAAKVEADERVLDLACGTGELERRMVNRQNPPHIVGVDVAPSMLDRARAKLGNHPNVRFKQADAHDLPFADDGFEVVMCANTFHYFTHPGQVLREARRVLVPGGRLVILDWCRDFWTCRLMDVVLSYGDPAYDTCYTLAELEGLLNKASFDVSGPFRYRFDLVWGMMGATAFPTDA